LFQKTAGFPKRFRHSLTERLEMDTLAFERALIEANALRGRERMRWIEEADALLEALRLNMRRGFDLHCLAGHAYEFGAKALNEIGKLLGAWKQSTAKQIP
jgi:hypothetical protein